MIQNIKLYLLENNTGPIPGVKENPRDLTGDGFAKAKQSIKDFPEMLEVRTLVVVKHGEMFVVIGGNQRLRAMRDLDYDTAPVMVVDWPVDKINEFIIKDNIEYGVWNFDLLANEWDSNLLVDWGMNLPVEFGDVEEPLEGLTDEDATPEPPELPKTKLGDIYILGNHRLMCGDSTSIDAVEKLMDGQKADMVFTDPPYGVDYDGGHATEKRREKLANDDNVNMYDLPLKNAYLVSTDKASLYLWFADRFAESVIKGVNDAGFDVRSWIIWNKNVAQFGAIGAQYKSKHEPCIYAFKHGKAPNWCGPTNEVTVWDISRDHKNSHHPTQKPVALSERAFTNHSVATVLDLFGGSGSTLISAEKNNKRCFVMELSEGYCDVIIKRWQDFTGKDAVLESTQQKFNEL